MEPRLGYLVFTAPLDQATRGQRRQPSASGSDLWMPGSGPGCRGLTLCQPLPGVLARVVTRLVREPEGNGCAGLFVRTLKESLRRVHRFDGIEELRQTLHGFKNTYNRTWIVERHRYRTPAQIRADQFGLPEAAWCKRDVSHPWSTTPGSSHHPPRRSSTGQPRARPAGPPDAPGRTDGCPARQPRRPATLRAAPGGRIQAGPGRL
jgi:hypothetical protein